MKKYVIPVILPYLQQRRDWIFDNQEIAKESGERINKQQLIELVEKHLNKLV